MKPIKTILAAGAVALGGTSLFAGDNPMVGGAEMFPNRTIVANAATSAEHTTLVSAVQAAGLAGTLSGAGPFTVFAPTNYGFDRIEGNGLQSLMARRALLKETLACHVVSGTVTADALKGMVNAGGGSAMIDTLGGCQLEAKYSDDNRLMIVDENGNGAFVNIADVMQSNGVVHVVDGVMLPRQP